MDIKIHYIFHSGILFETKDHYLLIDYYMGDLPVFDKKTYIIASHQHRDHFNPQILEFEGDISYILSDDIQELGDYSQENGHFVSPDNTYDFGPLKLETFGSTDQGISMLAHLDGKSIYHGGDLNLWIWPEDSPEERRQMTKDFKYEVDKLKGKSIDYSCFAVDSRLKDKALGGPRYFLENVDTKYFIPIHMCRDSSYAYELKDIYKDVEFLIADGKNQVLI